MKKESTTKDCVQKKNLWSLYVIRCVDDSLYCGISNDVQRRFAEHQAMGKKTAKYLRGRGPLSIVLQNEIGDRSAASKIEARFKSLDKIQKESIIRTSNIEELLVQEINRDC